MRIIYNYWNTEYHRMLFLNKAKIQVGVKRITLTVCTIRRLQVETTRQSRYFP